MNLQQIWTYAQGTDKYHYSSLYPWLHYTDSVKEVAETAGAYWFIDTVGTEFYQFGGDFAVVTLLVEEGNEQIVVDDGNGNVLYTKELEYTDFPCGEWKFYLVNNVLMLPGDY